MDDIYKAAGIIIEDKKLLFTRAKDMEIFIDPGGKIEEGEAAKQALVRELKEELSIDVDEADLELFGEYTAEAANHTGRTVHMQAFIVKKYSGEIAANSEIEELRWVTSDVPSDIKVGSIFGGEVLPALKAKGLVDWASGFAKVWNTPTSSSQKLLQIRCQAICFGFLFCSNFLICKVGSNPS